MKKVIVIGCPGSGKSTFSRGLAAVTGLPLFYLDQMYWNADKSTVEKSVFRERLALAMSGDAWIIDGNYGSTMEMRMEACDTVFFLDLPAEICLEGIRSRRGKPRADMPWFEKEGEEDEEFLKFIRAYNQDSRPRVLELLAQNSHKKIFTFHSRAEADSFLASLRSK